MKNIYYNLYSTLSGSPFLFRFLLFTFFPFGEVVDYRGILAHYGTPKGFNMNSIEFPSCHNPRGVESLGSFIFNSTNR